MRLDVDESVDVHWRVSLNDVDGEGSRALSSTVKMVVILTWFFISCVEGFIRFHPDSLGELS